MKYTIYDSEGRTWEMETLPRQVTPNFIGMTKEEKRKILLNKKKRTNDKSS